jgi:hypothetical protein
VDLEAVRRVAARRGLFGHSDGGIRSWYRSRRRARIDRTARRQCHHSH